MKEEILNIQLERGTFQKKKKNPTSRGQEYIVAIERSRQTKAILAMGEKSVTILRTVNCKPENSL